MLSELMKKMNLRVLLAAAALTLSCGIVGCENDAGDDVQDAVEDAGDAVGDAVEDTGDAIKDATN